MRGKLAYAATSVIRPLNDSVNNMARHTEQVDPISPAKCDGKLTGNETDTPTIHVNKLTEEDEPTDDQYASLTAKSSNPEAGQVLKETSRKQENVTLKKWNYQGFLARSGLLLWLCLNCYYNSVQCGFVFDDNMAIMTNEDLRPSTHVLDIFKNDFWGTGITSDLSHKSYRPLTVLTFRWTYAMSGLDPAAYHLTNVLLHWVLCVIISRVFTRFLREPFSFLLAVLFTVHPIHTETVAGVVGRADILFSIFAILAFWSYTMASHHEGKTAWRYIFLTILLTMISTLCKEQGITIIAVCWAYDIFWLQKINLWQGIHLLRVIVLSPRNTPSYFRTSLPRLFALIAAGLVFVTTRISLMGSLPRFSEYDNPASFTSWPTKHLTFAYLYPLNIWLLFYPYQLLCDYSAGVIPFVTSMTDPRNLATVNAFVTLMVLSCFAITGNSRLSRQVAMAMSFLIFPFLPASNIFFSVGFVVAERILYLPSLGFIMLIVIGLQRLLANKRLKFPIHALLVLTISLHGARTARRNIDWLSTRSIFHSGLLVSAQNAKLWINFGHTFEGEGRFEKALACYNISAHRPFGDQVGAYTEMGRTYSHMKMYDKAIEYLKKCQTALEPYHKYSLYNQKYVESFVWMGKVQALNESTWTEAIHSFKTAIKLDGEKETPYRELSRLYSTMNDTNKAIGILGTYLKMNPRNCRILIRLAELLRAENRLAEARSAYESCLQHEPGNKKVQVKWFEMMENTTQHAEDEKPHYLIARYSEQLKKSPEKSHLFHIKIGDLYRQMEKYDEAIYHFSQSLLTDPTHISVLTAMAIVYSSKNDTEMAYEYLRRLVEAHPNYARGWQYLGYFVVEKLREFAFGEQCLTRAVQLDPTNLESSYTLCIIHVQRKDNDEALKCFEQLLNQYPDNEKVNLAYDNLSKAILEKSTIVLT